MTATSLKRRATATRLDHAEILFALAAFAALGAAALSFAPGLVER